MSEHDVIRAVYEDDSVDDLGAELQRRLPHRSVNAMQVFASVHGWAKARQERRIAAGLPGRGSAGAARARRSEERRAERERRQREREAEREQHRREREAARLRRAVDLVPADVRAAIVAEALASRPPTIPTVSEDVMLPWRAGRPEGNVRPVMCPRCGDAFAVPADPRSR